MSSHVHTRGSVSADNQWPLARGYYGHLQPYYCNHKQATLAKHVIMSLDDDPTGSLLSQPSSQTKKYLKKLFVHFLAVRHTEALWEKFAPRLNQYWTIAPCTV